jgi:pyrroloquinoline quinone biosynthesis protein B
LKPPCTSTLGRRPLSWADSPQLRLRLLGSAAGGGYPQWNCACAQCQTSRVAPARAESRTQCSLAFSAGGEEWYLIGAGPDIRFQIEAFPPLHPGPKVRETPLRGVFLADAEMDHMVGLLLMREGSDLDVFGPRAILAALEEAFPIRRLTQRYCSTRWISVVPGQPIALNEGRLEISAFPLGTRSPRYVTGPKIEGEWVVGYRLVNGETGGTAVFAPGIERWSPELEALLAGADCAFVDGTFWSEDEMVLNGVGHTAAAAMGHMPIAGEHGSAVRLAAADVPRVVYVHLNNTNPILDERSPERGWLRSLGIEVGHDGMEVTI